MSIKTILIDDEPLALLELKEMLKKHTDIEVVATAADSNEALQQITEHKPALIFLDINMPGKSGFDLLEELDEVPHVIFVTAYDSYAIKAFEVNALDYLMKPLNPLRLEEAIQKVRKLINTIKNASQKLSADKKIFIKDGDNCFFVPLNEVYLIESLGNYARFFYQDKKPLLHKSLTYLEQRLPETHFFRVSRQHIVNIHYIKKITPFHNILQLELENGAKVDVSQRQSVLFKEIMGI